MLSDTTVDYFTALPKSATLLVLLLHRRGQVGPFLFLGGLDGLQVESFLELPGQLHEDVLDVLALFGRTLHIG